jgi:hypothetical protein
MMGNPSKSSFGITHSQTVLQKERAGAFEDFVAPIEPKEAARCLGRGLSSSQRRKWLEKATSRRRKLTREPILVSSGEEFRPTIFGTL